MSSKANLRNKINTIKSAKNFTKSLPKGKTNEKK